MRTKLLADVIHRLDAWPPEAQDRLAEIALDIEADMSGEDYHPRPDELAGIDRGLRAAAEGRFATEKEVEAAFAKLRRG